MRSEPLRLRISTPAPGPVPGRGFYQLEESALYVPIGAAERNRRFFSYLESERIRLDLDKNGRLMFIELAAGRHTWRVIEELPSHPDVRCADIRWLDFRQQIAEPHLFCDRFRQSLLIKFSSALPSQSYVLAESVVLSADSCDCLVSILVNDIVDDLAGREIARFRKEARTEEPVQHAQAV